MYPTVSPTASTPADSARPAGDLESLIRTVLREFVDSKAEQLAGVSPQLGPIVRKMNEILNAGGGRPGPAFCYWGWRAAGGDAEDGRILTAAAALDLLRAGALSHAGALGHEDELSSAERDPAAILLGDLCLTWCAELFYGCGLPAGQLRAGAGLFHLMHAEVVTGTYLALLEPDPVGRARLVARSRSAGFSGRRAMQLGASVAGAGPALVDGCGRFAAALGEAVELRAEVTGVFGDGKDDDLRRGRATVLIALARERGNPGQRAELQALYGDPDLTSDGAERLRGIITDTRALAAIEELIVRQVNEALGAIHRLPAVQEVKEALTALAVATADGV